MLKRIALMESISSNLHGFLKKNRQQFVSAGQKVPSGRFHRPYPLRPAYRLSDGEAIAQSAGKIPLAPGQT
jgi:hypothetical protein